MPLVYSNNTIAQVWIIPRGTSGVTLVVFMSVLCVHSYRGSGDFCCFCSVAQSCLSLCDPVDSSPPGSSVHGLSQAGGILEWVAISFSRRSSQPRDQTRISILSGGFFITLPPGKPSGEFTCWKKATWELLPLNVEQAAMLSFPPSSLSLLVFSFEMSGESDCKGESGSSGWACDLGLSNSSCKSLSTAGALRCLGCEREG